MGTFGPWDYVVFGLMLAGSSSIGVYYAVKTRKRRSTNDYLVASQSMTFLPVALSLIATSESSVMMLGTAAESYAFGIQLILSEFGSAVGTIIEIIVTLTFLKRLNLSTPFELQYMSVVLYGQAIAIQTVTGLSMYAALAVTASITVIYTSIGGLKAVIWTDVLQFTIMMAGMLAVIVKGTLDADGVVELWGRAADTGRLNFSLDLDPTVRHTVWNLFFGRIMAGFGYLFIPTVLQRISSTRSLRETRRAILVTIPAFPIILLMGLAQGIVAYGYYDHKRCDPVKSKQISSLNQILPFFTLDLFHNIPGMSGFFLAALSSASLRAILVTIPAFPIILLMGLAQGIVAYGYYDHKRCDPVKSKQISSLNQILPFFTLDLFHNIPGMSGFFLAALSSASLSTISSCLSAVAHITWHDIVKPCRPNMSEFRGVLVAKTTVVMCGVLSCILAVVVSEAGTKTLNQIVYTLLSIARSPLNALFYLGALFPFVNTKGAITGLLAGVSLMLWLSIGSMYSSAGSASTYLRSAPTDNCPGFNVTSSSFVNFTSTIVPEQNEVVKSRSDLDTLYNLSYTLFSTMAIGTVLLVGLVTSFLTGGNEKPIDPDCLIRLEDIQCWCVPDSLRTTPKPTRSGDYELTPVEGDLVLGEDISVDKGVPTRSFSATEAVLAGDSNM